MRWEVIGADAFTGVDQTIHVEAADEQDAVSQGNHKGLFVETVRRVDLPRAVQAEADPTVTVVTTVATRRMLSANGEEIFYSGIGSVVTDSHVELGGRTYVLSNIASIETQMMQPDASKGYRLLALGAVAAITGVLLCLFADPLAGMLVLAAGILTLAAKLYAMKRSFPMYAILLDCGPGSHIAYLSQSMSVVQEIQEAIIQASAGRKGLGAEMDLQTGFDPQWTSGTTCKDGNPNASNPMARPRRSMPIHRLPPHMETLGPCRPA